MKKIIDLTGQKFGRLTVLSSTGQRDKNNRVVWTLECDCGNHIEMVAANFKYGNTSSCGCLKREVTGEMSRTHGMSKTPIYSIWLAMHRRCGDVKHKDYPQYGGRGISVCARWDLFENFHADMGDRPESKTLDRIDVNGDYTPSNCRWATNVQQARNRRDTIHVTFKGVTKPLRDFCDELLLNCGTVYTRLNQQNWTVDRALTTPTGRFTNV
jgi:hypothetical protein